MKALVFIVAIILAGCEARVNIDSKPTAVKVASENVIQLREICYDGVTYVLTPLGGIAPKLHGGGALGINPVIVECK